MHEVSADIVLEALNAGYTEYMAAHGGERPESIQLGIPEYRALMAHPYNYNFRVECHSSPYRFIFTFAGTICYPIDSEEKHIKFCDKGGEKERHDYQVTTDNLYQARKIDTKKGTRSDRTSQLLYEKEFQKKSVFDGAYVY